jgi:phosphodiesterase/alkaline phosphatase D-like protein
VQCDGADLAWFVGLVTLGCLSGLLPNTVYYYKCGDPESETFSEESTFTTLPLPGPKAYPARIAIVGDLGLTYNSSTTLDHIIQNDPAVLILAGDMSYANQYLTTGEGAACYRCTFPTSPVRETHQPIWDRWCR